MSKLILGVGINDATYVVKISPTIGKNDKGRIRKLEWLCPFYAVWMAMLTRCYSLKHQKRRPTYIGCAVCEDWLTFSNFRNWMEQQDYEGNQLDKDLLVKSNKLYSPETCVFVSPEVNRFLRESSVNSRGEWPLGVCWSKQHGKFKAAVNKGKGKRWNLGLFSTPEEAHEAWLSAKLLLAYELAKDQKDARVAEALIRRYENYKES